MCGITGYLGRPDVETGPAIRRMTAALRHRGPDDSGVWLDKPVGLALGHTRLSILDLSAEGHQPMASPGGRYVVTYNGEIYNFEELRRELVRQGVTFRGHSDTEVMLAAFEQWGVEGAVRRFIGMFAFGLWDRETRTLHLVRDRIGIKPLYFGWAGGAFVFGSELKAIQASPGFQVEIDRQALALYLRHSYVPAPFSIFRSIYKLPPGCILAITPARATRESDFSPDPDDRQAGWKPERYWSARGAVEQGGRDPFVGSEDDALRQLEDLLRGSVRQHMVADVALGAFLSGGIDSSTVVALMQSQSARPVKTFTIGFTEKQFNEADYAGRVARHLLTEHTEFYASPQDALDVIPRLPRLFDEPFSDSSQIPTFLVSQLARAHVAVSLSGDGGDELFGGYNRYFWYPRIWGKIAWAPRWLRGAAACGLRAVSPHGWDRGFRLLHQVMPERLRERNAGYKLHKLAEVLQADNEESVYLGLISHWADPASLIRGGGLPPDVLGKCRMGMAFDDFTQQMMYTDTVTYLPDDILVKVDRASMGISLEARVPLLDHRLLEFAWRLPMHMKIRGGQGKWLLRQVLYKYVPKTFFDRPKMGFAVPLDSWLRGPLREWAEVLLAEKRLNEEGFFQPDPIREKWAEHLSGRRDWQYHLWDILMFQAWLDESKQAAAGMSCQT